MSNDSEHKAPCDSIHEWPAGSFLMCSLPDGHAGKHCAVWMDGATRREKTWDTSRERGETP